MSKKNALMLTGSPAKGKSTSNSLGEYVLESLDDETYNREIMHLYSVHNSDEKLHLMLERVNDAELIIIATPLYVDTTPAVVVRMLQEIHKYRLENKLSKEQKLLAIVNCGFPEVEHNFMLIKIFENFAKQTGFKWLGGVPVGMGGLISGRSLSQIGGIAKNLVKGMDLLNSRMNEEKPVNDDVVRLTSKKFMPKWLYRFMGNSNWHKMIKKNNVKKHVYDKPFA